MTEKLLLSNRLISTLFIDVYQPASRIAYLQPKTHLFQKNGFSAGVAEKISLRLWRIEMMRSVVLSACFLNISWNHVSG